MGIFSRKTLHGLDVAMFALCYFEDSGGLRRVFFSVGNCVEVPFF